MERQPETPEQRAEREEEQREEDAAWIQECRRRVPESADLEWDEFFHGVWSVLEVLDEEDASFLADDMEWCAYMDAGGLGWIEDEHGRAVFVSYLPTQSDRPCIPRDGRAVRARLAMAAGPWGCAWAGAMSAAPGRPCPRRRSR